VLAHKKVVSRGVAKKFNQGMKENVYRLLGDTGFFTDEHTISVYENNLMPWMLENVVKFANEEDKLLLDIDDFIQDHVSEIEQAHAKTVKEEQ